MTTESFDLMPNMPKTPESIERLNQAMERLNAAVSRCANEFRNLVDTLGTEELKVILAAHDGMGDEAADEMIDGIGESLDEWTNAGEELMRAVSGRDPAKTESTRYSR